MKSFLSILVITFLIHSQSLACPEGEHWVKAHQRRAYYKADGTFVKATWVKAHCRKNPEGFTYWEPKLKNDRPEKWPHKKESTKQWTTEEKERVTEALAELPEVLWGNSIIGIYRMDKSQISAGNPATSAEGIIVLYDSAFSKLDKTQPLARIIGHELAHEKYRKLSDSDLDEYHLLASWGSIEGEETKKVIWATPRKNFVKSDGEDGPDEDFANNLEYFLFEPTKLKAVTPNAYDWIKHHFGDSLKLRLKKADEKK